MIRRRRRVSDCPATPRPSQRRDRRLERIIADDRVKLAFQPIFSLADGQVTGAEALARAPMVGSAERLFARAEAGGLGERLSRSIQRKALQAAARWTGPLAGLRLSINLLAADVDRPGFDQWLVDQAQAAGFPLDRLTVEITESTLIADKGAVAVRLSRLRDEGVRVAIDDFGTGYASFDYLSALPLDQLKIDRALIADIAASERSRIIVQAMIALGQNLGLDVLVEGVEDEAQLALLREWGCAHFQGFLGSRALSADRFAAFVEARRARAA